MRDPLNTERALCPNCGADETESDAVFCQSCGFRLDAEFPSAPFPPTPRSPGTTVGEKYIIQSLLWSAPTYNAYLARSTESAGTRLTLLEQPSPAGGEADRGELPAGLDNQSLAASEEAAAAFDRFGLLKPRDEIIEGDSIYSVFDEFRGAPLAHLDQVGEKQARAIGVQLCALAEQFHRNDWIYNGFEPHGIILEEGGRIRLISLDRARRLGTPVANAPIYATKGYTAPWVFHEDAVYSTDFDVYSIGAVVQFLLSGESAGAGEGTGLYPVATVAPMFERLIARVLSEEARGGFTAAHDFRTALEELNLPVVLQSAHFTDVGLVRELNEDSVLALNLTQYFESVQTQIGLYIVSDGMGGEAAGEVASRVTVRAIAEWITDKLISASLKSTREEHIAAPTQTGGLRLWVADGKEMGTTEMLRKAVEAANREVLAYARAHPDDRGLGATVTVAMVVGEVLTISHVGDSRCYLLSNDRLEQITEDHSLVQKMVNTGSLSQADARIHPYRNVIYRSIGADENVEIDLIRRPLKSGDSLLLCSDGLNAMLSDDEIRDILMVNPDPNAAARELVVAANSAGGEDNTSVIVVRIS